MDTASAISSVGGQLPLKHQFAFTPSVSSPGSSTVTFGKLVGTETGSPGTQTAGDDAVRYKAVHDFSTVITQQFVDEMFKGQLTFGTDQGMQSDFQRTVFIKAISEQLAQSDALGIRGFIEQGISDK